jgi:hypothetical protein
MTNSLADGYRAASNFTGGSLARQLISLRFSLAVAKKDADVVNVGHRESLRWLRSKRG